MRLATHVYEFQLILYIRHDILAEDESGAVAVATLVMLAGRLPGHAEPSGDLRPSDAQADGMVDQDREFGLCLFLREPSALDLLQYLRWGHPRNPLRQHRWFRWRLVPPIWLHLLGSPTRLALRPSHTIQLAGEV